MMHKMNFRRKQHLISVFGIVSENCIWQISQSNKKVVCYACIMQAFFFGGESDFQIFRQQRRKKTWQKKDLLKKLWH